MDRPENQIPLCPNCHSQRIWATLKAPGEVSGVYILALGSPDSIIQDVYAWWCQKCGSIELHALLADSSGTDNA